MARPEKVAVVEEIRAKVAESDATVLTEYRGLKVHELAELRAALRPTGTEYKVFKNTLARRAMDAPELDGMVSLLEGPVAIAFVRGVAAAAAKALRDFVKTNDALVLKGGLLGGKVLEPRELEALAELPSREVLLAQIAGAFQAPLVKAAGLFQALPRNLAYGVKALIDQRVAAGEAAPEAETPEAEAPEAEAPEAEASEAPAAAVEADAPEVAADDAPAEEPAADESASSESESASTESESE
ncbi:MAG: 50S ribosomal protein L10 [Acidimicrobiia bacterium]